MTDLVKVAAARGEPKTQVVFLHGLSGHYQKTWVVAGSDDSWLPWLSGDLPNVAVWSVGYSAAVSRWTGHATHLVDRANTVLERLLAEPGLQTGELVLVGHSLGGLVIKQALRTAADRSWGDSERASFAERVRKIAFLATPHSGSGHANWADRLRIFVRPSLATASLLRNDPHLRDLNLWFRDWVSREEVRVLVLSESKDQGPLGLFGEIVKADSSDPGLAGRPILIDATHTSICKPADQSSDVYIHLKKFIASSSNNGGHENRLKTSLTEEMARSGSLTAQAVIKEVSQLLEHSVPSNTTIADASIQKELDRIRKARSIVGFNAATEAKRLASELTEGSLRTGSLSVKALGLAWCSRILSVTEPNLARQLVTQALSYSGEVQIAIAESFVVAAEGRTEDALRMLSGFDSPLARSASVLIVRIHRGTEESLAWLKASGIEPGALDSDGKNAYWMMLVERDELKAADQLIRSLSELDFQETPVLMNAAALSHLTRAVPDELQQEILRGVPFEASSFPLKLGHEALHEIRLAKRLFAQFSAAAEELGCRDASLLAKDYCLWLMLRDPESESIGMETLKADLRNPATSLRRLPLGLAFGLSIDLNSVETEIQRNESLAGGNTAESANARLAVALSKKSANEVLEYLGQHRTAIASQFGDELLSRIEAELAAQGAAQGEPSADELIQQYQSSESLIDLMSAVRRLEGVSDKRLSHYAGVLFGKTQGVADAERYAKALHNAGEDSQLISLVEAFPHFLEISDRLLELYGWSLYRLGQLKAASEVVAKLGSRRDARNDRALRVNIAIASGSWGSLLPIVENEWQSRETREAEELLAAADLGASTGSPRVKDLILAAVKKEPDDVGVLFNAYIMATRTGGEDSREVADWLQKAAELSGETGPVRRMSLREAAEMAPAWNETQKRVADLINAGTIPLFLAARAVNRTLVDLMLVPALLNKTTADVRQTNVIPVFSGSNRGEVPSFDSAVLDPTSLLSLGMLGVLDKLQTVVKKLVLPHATMAWLFGERKRVEFHQPSRIADAKMLQTDLNSGAISEFRPLAPSDQRLAAEVGETLASMLREASFVPGGSRFVVRGSPVHRISSLMEEEIDLQNYKAVLVSSMAVVHKLASKGALTTVEIDRAESYLRSQEGEWPWESSLPDEAVVYLDDVSLRHLQHLGLVDKLGRVGITAFVSSDAREEVAQLLQYESQASAVANVLEHVRAFVEQGIGAGSIVLGPSNRSGDESVVESHPLAEAMRLAGSVDVVVSDDRFVNHLDVAADSLGGTSKIITSLDLLSKMQACGALDEQEFFELMTKLRRAKLVCVPLSEIELQHHLSKARSENGRLNETGELKAIRENILRLQMSDMLRGDKDLPWLTSTLRTMLSQVRVQWASAPTVEDAIARAEWLLPQCDIRNWCHRFGPDSPEVRAEMAHASLMMIFATYPDDLPADRKEKYEDWAEEAVFAPLRSASRESFDRIVRMANEMIRSIPDER